MEHNSVILIGKVFQTLGPWIETVLLNLIFLQNFETNLFGFLVISIHAYRTLDDKKHF